MRTVLFQFALLALTTCVRAASQISLFTDSNCQDVYKGLEGPNGYPNGSCTDIRRSGEYGITIYIDDPSTTICGGYQEEIQLGQCWNSTFVYYSIDMCDTPNPSASPTSTSSSSKDNHSHGLTTGTLVGAVLGSLAGGALLLGFALWILARKKRARKARAAAEYGENRGGYATVNRAEADTSPYRSEMDGTHQRHEMEQGKVVYKHEVATPPVELGGWEVRGDGEGDEGGQTR
ncbi:hypothetical protein E8E11_009896 [Didymella keratinophila]|nr:hypothetical protein E8E11_009896 [Didymella keratinophila]